MRRPAARGPGPSDTVVEKTIISALHDIILALLVVVQLAIAVVSCALQNLISIVLGLVQITTSALNILKYIAVSIKLVVGALVCPFIALLRGVDSFCIAIHSDPSSHTHFTCFGVLLFVIQWYCSCIGWENIHPIMSTLLWTVLWIWFILSVWAVVAFLRYEWAMRELGNIRKRKGKIIPAVPKLATGSKIATKRKERSPRPVNFAQSRNGSLESLDEDANRNWSNEHGNLSPKPLRSFKFSAGDLRRRPAIAKVLDADSNRNWSNEHGNLSPKSLSPTESTSGNCDAASEAASSSIMILPSSSRAFTPAGHNKPRMTPATASTFTSRDERKYTPATTTTASTSSSILTPSKTDRINHEESLKLSTTSSFYGLIHTSSTPLDPGQFDLVNYLRDDLDICPGFFAPFSPTTSDTGSDVTAIYTPASANAIDSGSDSDTSAVKYTPNSITTSGSTVVYTPVSTGTQSSLGNRQLNKSSILTKSDALALLSDLRNPRRP